MTPFSNIAPNDNLGLTPEDKEKLKDYEVVKNLNSINVGDHFRYTQNKYQQQGRKLCYAVVHSIDYDNQILEVNGFKPKHSEEQKYANWQIDYINKYKNYIFYKKVNNNKC